MRDLLFGLVVFLAGGFGYAMGRAHAHRAFNRVMGETLAAIRKHLRAEGGEAREMPPSAAMMARLAVGFAETAEKDPAARELKAINESLQRAKSAETTAKVRFEQLYNGERKARVYAERRIETLLAINRSLSRQMVATFAVCQNDCMEASTQASRVAAGFVEARTKGWEDPPPNPCLFCGHLQDRCACGMIGWPDDDAFDHWLAILKRAGWRGRRTRYREWNGPCPRCDGGPGRFHVLPGKWRDVLGGCRAGCSAEVVYRALFRAIFVRDPATARRDRASIEAAAEADRPADGGGT